MQNDYDFLLVGQGIAGTALAWQLHTRGYRFLIVNDDDIPASSRVAAGIFNPLTGRKLVKTWLADTIFPYAAAFYQELASLLGHPFVHQADLFRPYRTPDEKKAYQQRALTPELQTYIASSRETYHNPFIHVPLGGLTITRSGWVDVPLFLDLSRMFFRENGAFRTARFQASDLVIREEGIEWDGKRFAKVVLCQGMEALNNPYFSWLPFNPVKGQLLEGEITGYDLPEIINQGLFILPYAKGKVRIGATYSWHDLDWKATDEGRQFLLSKVQPLLNAPFSVTGQKAGIRPATNDRRPFIGVHPGYQHLCIFNGLGTKGVTLAPYLACQFVNFLEKKEDLHPEVNISRHFSLYFHLQHA